MRASLLSIAMGGVGPLVVFTTTALLVIGGVLSSAAAMAIALSPVMYVAGGLCVLNSIAVVVNQYKLSKLDSLRQSINELRETAHILGDEVQILTDRVDQLRREAERLGDFEKDLENLANEQGQTSKDLISLVHENESILAAMKDNLRQDAVADIAEIVLQADRNEDWIIDLRELKTLTLSIKLRLAEHGVELDQEKFMNMVHLDNGITHVLKVVGGIMFKEESEDEEPVEDVGGDLILPPSSASDRRTSESEQKAFASSMFTVQDKYARGSSDIAHGSNSNLVKVTKRCPKKRIAQLKGGQSGGYMA